MGSPMIYHLNVPTVLKPAHRVPSWPLTPDSPSGVSTCGPAGKFKGPRWDECIVGEITAQHLVIGYLALQRALNSGHGTRGRKRSESAESYGEEEASVGDLKGLGVIHGGGDGLNNDIKGVPQQWPHPHLWHKQKKQNDQTEEWKEQNRTKQNRRDETQQTNTKPCLGLGLDLNVLLFDVLFLLT